MMRHRTLISAVAALAVFWACGRAEAEDRLTAGDPIVLVHPPINKSIGNPVYCLTFLPGGTALATGAASGVLIWDVPSGKLRRTLEVDARGVDTLALDPQGKLLVAGGASGIIKIWDAKTLEPVRTLGPAPGAIQSLSISPDGKLLAAVGPNAKDGVSDKPPDILLWELATGRELPTIPHPSPAFGATALSFLPNGKQFVTAQDRTLRVWDVDGTKPIKTIEMSALPRTFGSIALHGKRLVAGAYDHKLRLWGTDDWKQVHMWLAHNREPPPRCGVSAVNFSPEGKYVLSGGMDGWVGVWDAASGNRLLELDACAEESARRITGVALTPDGALLAAAHFGGNAVLWRITGKE
jgi:WD40 repeat protein